MRLTFIEPQVVQGFLQTCLHERFFFLASLLQFTHAGGTMSRTNNSLFTPRSPIVSLYPVPEQ
jgi:hypothetical protein